MTAEELIAHCRRFLFVREIAPNSSPEIDRWLARFGLAPGASWCAVYACSMVLDLDPLTKLKTSAGALALLAKNAPIVVHDPQPGDIMVWDHGHGLGHVAVVTGVVRVGGVVASVTAIAGNTSADGVSRNGDRVAEHEVSLDHVAGYLRVCVPDPQSSVGE